MILAWALMMQCMSLFFMQFVVRMWLAPLALGALPVCIGEKEPCNLSKFVVASFRVIAL